MNYNVHDHAAYDRAVAVRRDYVYAELIKRTTYMRALIVHINNVRDNDHEEYLRLSKFFHDVATLLAVWRETTTEESKTIYAELRTRFL